MKTDLFSTAVREHLRRNLGQPAKRGAPALAPPPAWMSAFGGLRHLHNETQRINRVLEEEFEKIDADQWR